MYEEIREEIGGWRMGRWVTLTRVRRVLVEDAPEVKGTVVDAPHVLRKTGRAADGEVMEAIRRVMIPGCRYQTREIYAALPRFSRSGIRSALERCDDIHRVGSAGVGRGGGKPSHIWMREVEGGGDSGDGVAHLA